MSDWRKHDPVGSCRIYCSFYDRCLCTVFKAKKIYSIESGICIAECFFASALCRTCVKWIFLCLKSMDLGVWDADCVHLCKNISGIVYTDSEGKKKDICYASHILWNCIASWCGAHTAKYDGGNFSGSSNVYCIVVWFFFCEKKKSYDYGVCFSDRRNFV